MQYVRNLSDSVSTAWNSINPATLSGAIDVIIVEQEDGTLTCSPFHVRFGKFSLLRPFEKKVEFKVNGIKQPYAMKLGEGGEAFFVFETTDAIPQSLQTSPLVSPSSSPPFYPQQPPSPLQEPESLDLNDAMDKPRSPSFSRPPPTALYYTSTQDGLITPRSVSPELSAGRPASERWSPPRPYSEDILQKQALIHHSDPVFKDGLSDSEGSHSPPPLAPPEALQRAMALSKKLAAVDIPTRINDAGDVMLDMSAFKSNDEDTFRVEIVARNALLEELDGNYDIGALIGLDEHGNIWIYSSEEAKKAAMARMKRTVASVMQSPPTLAIDAASDPGYHSDGGDTTATPPMPIHRRAESDVGQSLLQTPPSSPGSSPAVTYAKTLRLTSDQLKTLGLKPGENSMSFTVNRATCSAYMYLWKHSTPVVISDIDGTITKSDVLGQVLNTIGRDWTHTGVAKLYSDIAANGYNIMYLTSRSVGQADSTRAYLHGILQEGYRLPRGPTILSPDRTMAALRREIYLRKPHIFKMSTLRDIRNLYGSDRTPFYAGFGNRFTDQISYRTVDVPRNRIFTINSNAEVSLDLLSLNKLKLSYVNMTEVVDHYFPPVSTLVHGGGEEYTDFRYWRDTPLELDEFSASESEDAGGSSDRRRGVVEEADDDQESQYADEEEEEEEEEEMDEGLGDSYISRGSMDEGSVASGSYDGDGDEQMMGSMIEDEDADDADDEDGPETRWGANKVGRGGARSRHIMTPTTGKPGLGSPRIAMQDLNAELITGVKNLAVDKLVK